MFWIVNSDQFPVWLKPVSRFVADAWIARGDAATMLPAEAFALTWAARHETPARWYLFPAAA